MIDLQSISHSTGTFRRAGGMLVPAYLSAWMSSQTSWFSDQTHISNQPNATLPGLPGDDPVIRLGRLNVVPLPHSYVTGDTTLCLSPTFSISFADDLPVDRLPQDLLSAVRRTEAAVRDTKHTYLSVQHGAEYFANGKVCGGYIDNLVLHLDPDFSTQDIPSIFSESARPAEERLPLEGYHLTVPTNEPARLGSVSPLGLSRGLTTFQQLFYTTTTSLNHRDASRTEVAEGIIYAPFGPYEISDRPAFPWRAVLLDTSRHYFSVPTILKQLDTMSLVKLNVFHWHITDSNSWPLLLDSHPELAVAAYSPAEVYTEKDIKHIIRYAGERGIDVVIEIDTPGHTATIAESHPDYVACFEADWQANAHQPPAGQLRFANETVVEFTQGLFESLAGVVESRYVGTGGDELNENCMNEDGPTQAILQEKGWTLDDALSVFTGKTHGTIRRAQKTPVVWQEMVLAHNVTSLLEDTIVTIWVSFADALRVLQKGHKIVHASGDFLYLDCGQGGWLAAPGGGGNSWCDPYKTWMKIHSFNPYDGINEALRDKVLGGQVSLWAEQTDEENVEQMIWPRAAALAEAFWTTPAAGYPLDTLEALPRMHDIRYRMVSVGVKATPLQPHWCALRPGACSQTRAA